MFVYLHKEIYLILLWSSLNLTLPGCQSVELLQKHKQKLSSSQKTNTKFREIVPAMMRIGKLKQHDTSLKHAWSNEASFGEACDFSDGEARIRNIQSQRSTQVEPPAFSIKSPVKMIRTLTLVLTGLKTPPDTKTYVHQKHPSRFFFYPQILHNHCLQCGTHQRQLAVFHTAVHSEQGIILRLEKFNKLTLLST